MCLAALGSRLGRLGRLLLRRLGLGLGCRVLALLGSRGRRSLLGRLLLSGLFFRRLLLGSLLLRLLGRGRLHAVLDGLDGGVALRLTHLGRLVAALTDLLERQTRKALLDLRDLAALLRRDLLADTLPARLAVQQGPRARAGVALHVELVAALVAEEDERVAIKTHKAHAAARKDAVATEAASLNLHCQQKTKTKNKNTKMYKKKKETKQKTTKQQ